MKVSAQLVVRESQAAVFFRDGKDLDVFGAGRWSAPGAGAGCDFLVQRLPSAARGVGGGVREAAGLHCQGRAPLAPSISPL